MARISKKSLRGRWTPDSARTWSRALAAKPKRRFFIQPVDWEDAPTCVSSDGTTRLDMRGLFLHDQIEDKHIVGVDFSAMKFESAGQFNRCLVEDCVFDGADVDTNLRKQFNGCTFIKANLKRAVLAETFTDCNFTGAKMRISSAPQTKFVRCQFDGADLRSAHWMHCVFEDCSFTGAKFGGGSLARSQFIGTKLAGVDLADTILDGVQRP